MNVRIKQWLLAYGVAAMTFALIDLVWIATVANSLYQAQIGHLLASEFNLAGAAAFYLGYVAGVVHFGIQPHRPDATLGQRIGGAALFGLFTYGTWGLTALAILEGFPALVAVTDIAWGVGVCSLVTFVTTILLRRSFKPVPA